MKNRFLLIQIVASLAFAGSAIAAPPERVVESFDYPAGPGDPTDYEGGEGWNIYQPKWVGGTTEGYMIAEGSLTYTDATGKPFPVAGNRVENKSSGDLGIRRLIDDELPAFESLWLDAESSDARDERSMVSLGKGGGTLWFSVLIQPNAAKWFYIHLKSRVYNAEGAGVVLDYSGGKLRVGQNWGTNRDQTLIRDIILPYPYAPTWVVARIEFGKGWGTDANIRPLDNRRLPEEGSIISEPTGKLTLWLNPALATAPDDSSAVGQCQLNEFRMNEIFFQINEGGALDEIRLGTTFEAVNK